MGLVHLTGANGSGTKKDGVLFHKSPSIDSLFLPGVLTPYSSGGDNSLETVTTLPSK